MSRHPGGQRRNGILVVGGTGKTGRRVAERLTQAGRTVRAVSRSTDPAFDWAAPEGWGAALEGMAAAYITYSPDLIVPEAAGRIDAFARLAVARGVTRLVLLSGRGEEGARAAEEALKASGADWTILSCSWFAQNFSENFLRNAVLQGEIALPVGPVGEPFIDADDIADIAVLALTGDGHAGQFYELTGPRLLTFAEATAEVAEAAGRPVRYVQLTPADYTAQLDAYELPDDLRALLLELFLLELFLRVLDGRNAYLTGDVERVLGRPARDFADYARGAAAAGAWDAEG